MARDIVPLFASSAETEQPSAFLGTGFLVTSGVLVTCWHCVRDALRDGLRVQAVIQPHSGGSFIFVPVTEVEHDANGADLASGRVDLVATVGLTLADGNVPTGTDVWTYGYPFTESPTERRPRWLLQGRFLQGYVTRLFYFGESRIPSYELDMRAPEGLSGAPLVQIPSRNVVGVVYGANEVTRIESFGRIDPATGERTPEIQRVEYFALGHLLETLRALRGAATEGQPLAEYVASQSAKVDAELAALYGTGPQPGPQSPETA